MQRRSDALRSRMADWKPIRSAPFDCEIEVSVLDREGYHAFIFPVRRTAGGWTHPDIKGPIPIDPTHWRLWEQQRSDR